MNTNQKHESYHVPVLLHEAVDALQLVKDGVYVDATFGGGGHAKEILKRLKAGTLVAFDRDAEAKRNTWTDERLVFINQNFKHLKKMLRVNGYTSVNGILADLGVSSFQIDTAARGFAHRMDGLLDMRMDESDNTTAASILNSYSAGQLQQLFSEYGEVRNARTLALRITGARADGLIETISQFNRIIQPCLMGNHNRYLSQVYQALRIAVNDEMNGLKEFLTQAKEVLASGGRLVVISYHSLEDRIVKNFFRSGNADGIQEQDAFGNTESIFKVITKKPIVAGADEVRLNVRARSAKMRIAEKR